jgi:hypothetical protein
VAIASAAFSGFSAAIAGFALFTSLHSAKQASRAAAAAEKSATTANDALNFEVKAPVRVISVVWQEQGPTAGGLVLRGAEDAAIEVSVQNLGRSAASDLKAEALINGASYRGQLVVLPANSEPTDLVLRRTPIAVSIPHSSDSSLSYVSWIKITWENIDASTGELLWQDCALSLV